MNTRSVRFRRIWALSLSLVLLLSGVPALAQEGSARSKAAEGLYGMAREAFAEEDYRAALKALLEVYKLDPNPIILYNIGRSYEELGWLGKAAEYFQRAARDPKLPPELQAEVGKRLPRVLPALKVQDTRMMSARSVQMGLRRAGDAALDAFIASKQGEKKEAPKAAEEGPDPVFLWSGVGGAALGSSLLLGAFVVDLNLSDPIAELKRTETRQDEARTRSLQDQIRDDQNLATVLYVTGGLSLALGTTLIVLSLNQEEKSPEPGASLHFSPLIGKDTVGFGVGGVLP